MGPMISIYVSLWRSHRKEKGRHQNDRLLHALVAEDLIGTRNPLMSEVRVFSQGDVKKAKGDTCPSGKAIFRLSS